MKTGIEPIILVGLTAAVLICITVSEIAARKRIKRWSFSSLKEIKDYCFSLEIRWKYVKIITLAATVGLFVCMIPMLDGRFSAYWAVILAGLAASAGFGMWLYYQLLIKVLTKSEDYEFFVPENQPKESKNAAGKNIKFFLTPEQRVVLAEKKARGVLLLLLLLLYQSLYMNYFTRGNYDKSIFFIIICYVLPIPVLLIAVYLQIKAYIMRKNLNNGKNNTETNRK